MDKNHIIERIVKNTLDNKDRIFFLCSGNKEEIEQIFLRNMRIFRKKICEGYDITADYYLVDFYTYMMLCEDWMLLDLHNELFNNRRCDMAITKHLEEVKNDLLSNKVNLFLNKYRIGL
jgi:hypothetical protein